MSARNRKRKVLRRALASMAYDVAVVGVLTLLACGVLYLVARGGAAFVRAFPRFSAGVVAVALIGYVVALLVMLVVFSVRGIRDWFRDSMRDARVAVSDTSRGETE